MALLPLLVGLACVVWTLMELSAAARRVSAESRIVDFSAIDLETRRPLHIQVDRRGRPSDRRAA